MPSDAVERWLTLLALLAAALAGLLYLSRQVWAGFRGLERLSDLVAHELSANGGSSMKDDVAAMAIAVGQLQRDVRDLATAKQTAHELLQLQLDTINDELGVGARHRRKGKT